jgi:hypothetical protein
MVSRTGPFPSLSRISGLEAPLKGEPAAWPRDDVRYRVVVLGEQGARLPTRGLRGQPRSDGRRAPTQCCGLRPRSRAHGTESLIADALDLGRRQKLTRPTPARAAA